MEFSEALNEFLSSHGKTLADLSSLTPGPDEPGSSKQSVDPKPSVVHVVDKVANRSYRRLRLFSGRVPVPSGELDFENWRRLARQLLKDESLPDAEKKSRITESLVPPALNLVWAVSDGSPAQEYLACLTRAYGSTSDGDELLTQFRCTYQKGGEKASEYLLRLHTLLTQVVEMDGIAPMDADKALSSQFQRGCLYNDDLLHMLQLRPRDDPPNMLDLLREVRTAEALLEDKADRRKGEAKPVKKATSMVLAASSDGTATKSTPTPTRDDSGEVAELRQAVDRLHRRLDGFFKSPSSTNRRSSPSTPVSSRSPRSIFCYSCGEDGHRMDGCTKPKNPPLVQEKMMARMKTSKDNQGSGNDGGQL